MTKVGGYLMTRGPWRSMDGVRHSTYHRTRIGVLLCLGGELCRRSAKDDIWSEPRAQVHPKDEKPNKRQPLCRVAL